MIRSIVLAASAIAIVASAPAMASELRVKIAGKSTEQVRTDIVKAAGAVCWKDVRGESLSLYLYPACVRSSVHQAIAQINDPALAAYNAANPADVPAPALYAAK